MRPKIVKRIVFRCVSVQFDGDGVSVVIVNSNNLFLIVKTSCIDLKE